MGMDRESPRQTKIFLYFIWLHSTYLLWGNHYERDLPPPSLPLAVTSSAKHSLHRHKIGKSIRGRRSTRLRPTALPIYLQGSRTNHSHQITTLANTRSFYAFTSLFQCNNTLHLSVFPYLFWHRFLSLHASIRKERRFLKCSIPLCHSLRP